MHVEPYTAIRTNCHPKSYTYTVKFDRDITSPEYWQEELDTLRMGKEGDDYIIHVNSHGGDASTLAEILYIIEHSPSHFHCVLAGNAFSAGGPIMLACDSVEVGDFATMMVHTAQGSGYHSSSQSLEQYSAMNQRTARKILSTCYEGFMTSEEINQALDGKEFWFDSDEIKERLTKRDEYFNSQYQSLELSISREQAETMTKEQLLAAIYGEDVVEDGNYMKAITTTKLEMLHELGVDITSEDIDCGYVEFSGTVSIYNNGYVYLGDCTFKTSDPYQGDIHFARELCDNLGIEYKKSHNVKVLVKKITTFVDKVVDILNME